MRVRQHAWVFRVGVAGRNRPAEMGSGGRARGHSEGGHFLPSNQSKGKCVSVPGENDLARNSGSGVIVKHLRLPGVNPEALGFNGDIGFKADGETGAIGEIDLNVGAIAAIFKDGALVNDFSGEFFAFNHGFYLRGQNCVRTKSSLAFDFGAYHTHRV